VSAADVIQAVLSFGENDVVVHINSPGGSVTEGLAIYNTFKNHPTNIQMRIEGVAASAASFIAMAGNSILIEPNAMVMIHDAWDLTIGNQDDHIAAADLLGKASNNLANIYAKKTGVSPDDMRTAMKAETWYIGQEAVDAGLADKVGGASSTSGQNKWEDFVIPSQRHMQNKTSAPAETYDFGSFLSALKGVHS